MKFGKNFSKTHRRDVIIMIGSLVLSLIFCIYQFYLRHFGLALIFSFVAFINTLLFTIYCSVYYKTQKFFQEAEKMVDEMIKEIEEKGKI